MITILREPRKALTMHASEARIAANRKNAERSTGPKTEEGKARSRQNSLKHGLTGAGVVLIEADAAEVDRRIAKFTTEVFVDGEIGEILVRRAAIHSVRMDRAADQQIAALTEHVRQVEADFVAPEGVDEAEAEKLRAEAVRIAMINPSKEASLVRRYEAEAERGFHRAIKELRIMEKAADALLKAEEKERVDALVGSILARTRAGEAMDAEMDALYPELGEGLPSRVANPAHFAQSHRPVDVPITIGRGR